jgi:hypothetical protein
MADSVQSQLKQLLDNFGIQLAKDLEVSMNKALKDGSGFGRVQQAALQFNPKVKQDKSSLTLDINASDWYWQIIEFGRNGKKKRWHNRPGAKSNPKAPPSDVILNWIKKTGIKPDGISQRTSDKSKTLKTKKVKKAFLKSAKESKYNQLTFLIQRKIGNFGIKPKPFRDRVIEDGRLDKLETDIAKIIGKDITLQLTGI